MKALTLNELRQMVGQPVWCPKENAYGIITCDKYGKWAGIPFLYGVCKYEESAVEFNHNIVSRKLKCFRIEDKKEIPMKLLSKVDDCGNKKMVCPNCQRAEIFTASAKIYPYCPWCGQKLEGENTELKNAKVNLEDKLDQLKAEKAVNSKYKCGEYCRVCKNGYEIPSYTIGRIYGCLLNAECEGFVKRENERS